MQETSLLGDIKDETYNYTYLWEGRIISNRRQWHQLKLQKSYSTINEAHISENKLQHQHGISPKNHSQQKTDSYFLFKLTASQLFIRFSYLSSLIQHFNCLACDNTIKLVSNYSHKLLFLTEGLPSAHVQIILSHNMSIVEYA